MKNKAVFLDRDGTINVDKNYLYKIEEFEFVEGAVEGLKILSDLGYKLIVVTNQAGIGRGYYTEEDLEKLNRHMEDLLLKDGIKIEKCYFCPHHAEHGIGKYKVECECRKPKPGMIFEGIKEFNIEPEKSFMIGDKLSDAEAGINAGVTPIIVKTGKEITNEIKERKIEIYSSICEFAKSLQESLKNNQKK